MRLRFIFVPVLATALVAGAAQVARAQSTDSTTTSAPKTGKYTTKFTRDAQGNVIAASVDFHRLGAEIPLSCSSQSFTHICPNGASESVEVTVCTAPLVSVPIGANGELFTGVFIGVFVDETNCAVSIVFRNLTGVVDSATTDEGSTSYTPPADLAQPLPIRDGPKNTGGDKYSGDGKKGRYYSDTPGIFKTVPKMKHDGDVEPGDAVASIQDFSWYFTLECPCGGQADEVNVVVDMSFAYTLELTSDGSSTPADVSFFARDPGNPMTDEVRLVEDAERVSALTLANKNSNGSQQTGKTLGELGKLYGY